PHVLRHATSWGEREAAWFRPSRKPRLNRVDSRLSGGASICHLFWTAFPLECILACPIPWLGALDARELPLSPTAKAGHGPSPLQMRHPLSGIVHPTGTECAPGAPIPSHESKILQKTMSVGHPQERATSKSPRDLLLVTALAFSGLWAYWPTLLGLARRWSE